MNETANPAYGVPASTGSAGAKGAAAAQVYYISDRPEAYEVAGEVSHEAAMEIARIIAERAARRFPDIEFRVDSQWHSQPQGMEPVAAYIESNWERWVEHVRA